MPEVLDRCVRKVVAKGYDKNRVYAICSKSTGWVKSKGGKWIKKKEESFELKNIVKKDLEIVMKLVTELEIILEDCRNDILKLEERVKMLGLLDREQRGMLKTAVKEFARSFEKLLGDEFEIGTLAFFNIILARSLHPL